MARDKGIAHIAWAIALTTLAGVVLVALYLARDALLLIYISVLLAISFGPLVHAIEHRHILAIGSRRLPRWLAILVVYMGILAVLAVAGFLVIPPLIEQGTEVWARVPGWLDRGQTLLINRGWLTHRVTLEEAVRSSPASPGSAMGTVATALTGIATTVLSVITILLLTFYLLVESRTIFAAFARLFPREHRARVVSASEKISTKLSAWLSGQLILAGTIGATAALGLYLLGVPYFFFLGLVAAVGELIPIVGPIFSAVPAILVAFSVSPRTALFVTLFWIAQQQVENNLLVPKIMERQVGVSPVVVIAALLIGGSMLGAVGAILAVPSAAIVQVIVEELLNERDATRE